MAEPVYKILMFLKRRDGLSVAAFREHYETVHVKLAEKYVSDSTVRYVRRFIEPVGGEELPFDVITEIWLDNRERFEMICKLMVTLSPPPEILADEEWLFDRTKIRVASVIECDSDLEAVARANASRT